MTQQLSEYKGFLDKSAENLAGFLKPFVKDVETYYQWPFDLKEAEKYIDVDFSGLASPYLQTVKLKEVLLERLEACQSYDERYPFAEYFVAKWGGVGTNKKLKEALRQFDQLEDCTSITSLKGVSSWSKYLSLRKPEAAIYDSRVAYSINVINYLHDNRERFFIIPDGRSPRLNLLDIETLFVDSALSKSSDFITPDDLNHRQLASRVKKKFYLPERITYPVYLSLLKQTARGLDLSDAESFKIEMLLFALAPGAVLEALIKNQVSYKSELKVI
tara:strand:+ start:24636 stop:25457 length:822 start_codon:yes stop_codon:yes gene_type:complete